MHQLDMDDLARRYLAGETAASLAKRFGVGKNAIASRLEKRGIKRTSGEAQRLRFGSPEIHESLIVSLYRDGRSEKAIAGLTGVGRPTIRGILVARNVPIRGRGEANRLRMSQLSPEQRLVFSEKARAAIRGVPQSEEHRLKIARTREARQTQVRPLERKIADMLVARGLRVTPQKAVGRYNVDVAVTETSIAVEVFKNYLFAYGDKAGRFRERLEHLFDAGWLPVIVCVTNSCSLGEEAADYIVAVHEALRRGEPRGRQEHVIRGNGYGGPVVEGNPTCRPYVIRPETRCDPRNDDLRPGQQATPV